MSDTARTILAQVLNALPNTSNNDYLANLPTSTLRSLSYSLSGKEVDQLCGVSEKLASVCTDDYWYARAQAAYSMYVQNIAPNQARALVLYMDEFRKIQSSLGISDFVPQDLAVTILAQPFVTFYLAYPLITLGLISYQPSLIRDVSLASFPQSNVVVLGLSKRPSFLGRIPDLSSWGASISLKLIDRSEYAKYQALIFTPDKTYRMLSAHVLYQFLGDAQAKGYLLLSEPHTQDLRELVRTTYELGFFPE